MHASRFPSAEFKSTDVTPDGCTLKFKNASSPNSIAEVETDIKGEEDEKLIEDCLGFSKVVQKISNSVCYNSIIIIYFLFNV